MSAGRDRSGGPVVVFFYGGAWQSGNKGLYRFVAAALARRGYVAVLPDYRIYPEVRYPGFLEDGAQRRALGQGQCRALSAAIRKNLFDGPFGRRPYRGDAGARSALAAKGRPGARAAILPA